MPILRRFPVFAFVALCGLGIQLLIFFLALTATAWPFVAVQSFAAFVGTVFCFALNNRLTYFDRYLQGRAGLVGCLKFCALSTIGMLANVILIRWNAPHLVPWWLSGSEGFVASTIVDFGLSATLVWRG